MPLRYATERAKAYRILDLTSLTMEEFESLVPSFEMAFVRYMQEWTLEGKPRTGRRYSQYATCPLPSAEDRLLFVLTYLKQAPTQAFQGATFGMGQPKVNQWIQTLLPVLRKTLANIGDLPTRTRTQLSERLVALTQEPARVPFFTTALNEVSHVPRIRMHKSAVIAARKDVTP